MNIVSKNNIVILLSLLLFTITNNTVIAQVNKRGVPFYTNYSAKVYKGAEQNWAVAQDNRGVMYFGNNDNGVLEYDGVKWQQIPILNGSIVRSLAVDTNGIVYVGAVGDFGYLAIDKTGKKYYQSLLNLIDSSIQFADVWKTYSSSKGVYFCSQHYIFFYSNNTVQVKELKGGGVFSFLIDDELYVPSISEGIYKLKDTSLVFIPKTEYYINKGIYTMNKFQDKILLGTDHPDGFFYYDKKNNINKPAFKNNYLKQFCSDNFLYQSCVYDSTHLCVGTIYGGLLFLNNKGKIINYYDKAVGLRNETITSIYKDDNGLVWISQNDGLAKIEQSSPFRYFDDRYGIQGYINTICEFNNKLFLSTPVGVYYMKLEQHKTPKFLKIKGIDIQVNSLLPYEKNGKKQLLVGTIKGLYSIDKSLNVNFIDKQTFVDEDRQGNNYIEKLYRSKFNKDEIFVGLADGVFSIIYDGKQWKRHKTYPLNNNDIRQICEDKEGNVWFSTFIHGLVKSPKGKSDSVIFYGTEQGLPEISKLFISVIDNKITIGTKNGLYIYDKKTDKFIKDTRFANFNSSTYLIKEDIWGNVWFSAHNVTDRWVVRYKKTKKGQYIEDKSVFSRLPKEQFDDVYSQENGIVWLGSASGLYSFDNNYKNNKKTQYNTLIRKVIIGLDSTIFNGTHYVMNEDSVISVSTKQDDANIPNLTYKYNDISFIFAAPWFIKEKETEYSYILEGNDPHWRKWTKETKAVFTNLTEGEYTFKVKARNVFGEESSIAEYHFTISPPFWRTIVAFIIYAILFALLMYVTLKLYTRRLAQEKVRLEQIVEERTSEIREQNVKLQDQKEEILKQKEEITASIHYAERIQRAIVPSEDDAQRLLKDYFLLWKPRDIVSGDFWWMGEKDDLVVVTAADCTGHGVPGAFMSMLGVSFLNEIVKQRNILNSGDILNELRNKVKVTLGQTNEASSSKDGMDMGLLVLDLKNMKAQFSGAYNPLYLYRNGELLETKATRNPIAIYIKEKDFAQTDIELQKGDTLYVFSDGFPDQFGGDSGKKYSTKRFKAFLLSIQDKPMAEQRELLDKEILEWRGETEQIDDIIVLGIRI